MGRAIGYNDQMASRYIGYVGLEGIVYEEKGFLTLCFFFSDHTHRRGQPLGDFIRSGSKVELLPRNWYTS